MKIIEVLLLAQNEVFLEEMMHPISSNKDTFMGYRVYRWEVNPDLIILIYAISLEKEISKKFLDHIKSHLYGFLLVVDESFKYNLGMGLPVLEQFGSKMKELPFMIAVKLEMEKLDLLKEPLRKKGFILEEMSKMRFWNITDLKSVVEVWNDLFSLGLKKEVPAVEDTPAEKI